LKLHHQFVNDIQELYDIAPCGYMSFSLEGKIVAVNQTFLDWSGYLEAEVVSKLHFQELLTVPGNIFFETQLFPLLQLQNIVKAVAFDLVCKDGKILPVLLNATQRTSVSFGAPLIHSAIFDATDRRIYEKELLRARKELEEEASRRNADLVREVAERQRAEESLRELTAKLLQSRDDEQRRLARALHDSVGQLLAALAMNQSAIESEKARLSERPQAALAENIEIAQQISTEIRTISQLLHPPLLDEVGLSSALRWYIEGINRRGGTAINLEMPESFGRLPAEIETAIFRIIQECLTNSHRHGKSKNANVNLSRTSDFISITVADEGIGIPESKLEQIKSGSGAGVGLRGMRERVYQLNGVLDIASSEKGTVIQIRLPAFVIPI
jgi:PAS domain S-box-containing protein